MTFIVTIIQIKIKQIYLAELYTSSRALSMVLMFKTKENNDKLLF